MHHCRAFQCMLLAGSSFILSRVRHEGGHLRNIMSEWLSAHDPVSRRRQLLHKAIWTVGREANRLQLSGPILKFGFCAFVNTDSHSTRKEMQNRRCGGERDTSSKITLFREVKHPIKVVAQSKSERISLTAWNLRSWIRIALGELRVYLSFPVFMFSCTVQHPLALCFPTSFYHFSPSSCNFIDILTFTLQHLILFSLYNAIYLACERIFLLSWR
jgi:hypothetical protein